MGELIVIFLLIFYCLGWLTLVKLLKIINEMEQSQTELSNVFSKQEYRGK